MTGFLQLLEACLDLDRVGGLGLVACPARLWARWRLAQGCFLVWRPAHCANPDY